MLEKFLIACGLVGITVVMHSAGFSALLRVMIHSRALDRSGFWRVTGLVTGVASWLVLIHSAEIGIWGLFYLLRGCFPDVGSALYFSGATYTSAGYGDLVLPDPWRLLAPVESLTGILMCGLSTGLFFAVAARWIRNWMEKKTASEPHPAAPVKE